MNAFIAGIACASWIAGMFIMVSVFKSGMSRTKKIGACIVLLIPAFGPILYYVLIEPPAPQDSLLQNRGPRGSYTDNWVLLKPILEQELKEKIERESDLTKARMLKAGHREPGRSE